MSTNRSLGEQGQDKRLREVEEECEGEQERRLSGNASGRLGETKGCRRQKAEQEQMPKGGGRKRVRLSWNGTRDWGKLT